MTWGAVATSAISAGFSLYSSGKSSKAILRAGREEGKRLKWNADEAEKTAEINDQSYAFNIESSKWANKFNESEIRKEELYTRWKTGLNGTLARRQKRRYRGARRVIMASSGVASGGSMTDVMRDSEIETEIQIQSEVYEGLRQADKLHRQANIQRYKGEVEAWNLEFERGENKRLSKLEAEDLRWQAKVAEMGGQAGASAIKRQGYGQVLNSAIQGYDAYQSRPQTPTPGAFDSTGGVQSPNLTDQ